MAKFIIEIRSKGFETAKRDFEKAQKGAESYRKENDKLRGSTSGLRRNIGRLRNTLLLASFAFVGAAKSISGFVRASSGFQDVQTRLVGLTGSTEAAKDAFDAFNKIAATTPFALQDVVQAGATLEAFGVDSQNTLKAVTDLAAFMGTNATEAASALGRAFAGGAGAAEILRERGILELVRASQGIDDLSKLTLPQFRAALLSAMVDPVAGIQGSSKRLSETFTGAVSNMQDAITRFQAMIGDLMLPALTEVVKGTEEFFRAIDLQRLAQLATAIGVATTALVTYKGLVILATKGTIGLGGAVALVTGNFKKLIALGVTVGALKIADDVLQQQDAFAKLKKEVEELTLEEQHYKDAKAAVAKQLKEDTVVTFRTIEQERKLNDLRASVGLIIAENNGLDEKSIEIRKMMLNTANLLNNALGNRVEIDKEAIAVNGDFIVNMEKMNDSEKDIILTIQRLIEEQKKRIESGKEVVDINKDMASTFGTLEGAVTSFKNASGDSTQTLKVFLRTAAQLIALTGPQGAAASGALNLASAFIGHTGGLIKNNGIQRFAQGGMVQGQDNVPIMAQAGEFIMRREAVQNIGVGNLAQMNRSASGGGVTVNIQGNMVGNESFVRDTLIPEIARATNQNLA